MARPRQTKFIARRIDLQYFRRPHIWRRARFVVSILAVVGVLAWLGIAGFASARAGRRVNEALFNPGPVSPAHALFEQDCGQCHDGNGHGGFSKTVSDRSCLTCHDGAVHNPNQTTLISANGKTAAECRLCHVEHRGQQRLSMISNRDCLQCHADLPAATKGGHPDVQPHVTAFALQTHPSFGRQLKKDGKWADPTVLKFNHEKHMPMKGIEGNCTLCHSDITPPPGARAPGATDGPPWSSPKDRPLAWAGDSLRHYMQPISYQQHCISCHTLQVGPNGPTLPHVDMSLVRPQLQNLPQQYEQMLAADPKREAKLSITTVGPPPLRKKTTKKITEAEWVQKEMAQLAKTIDRDAGNDPAYAQLKKALAAATTRPTSGIDPSLVEFAVTRASSNSCSLCHEVRGQVPALLAQKPPASEAPTTAPGAELTTTVPTGIPNAPRRWFVSSWFDHDAHRDMGCLQCHGQALHSTQTRDVLMPDIASCVACHHAASEHARAAPSDCINCHAFHDRTKERPPAVNPPTPPRLAMSPTTQPTR